jgi:DNA-binding NtrC family response regulator
MEARMKKELRFLILEDDAGFRKMLEGVCAELGKVTAVSDTEAASKLLTQHTFDVLLIDWHLNSDDFNRRLTRFQSNASRIALFTIPGLEDVVRAMKMGAADVFWTTQERQVLIEKIKNCVRNTKSTNPFKHAFVSELAESLSEKAFLQELSLFRARKEFSKTFIQYLLDQPNIQRDRLAGLMNVSLRTLHRYLSV